MGATSLPTPSPGGQTREARVLELLDAHGQRDVVDAGGDGVAGVPESIGGRSAGILDSCDRHIAQLQRLGQRLTGAEALHSAQPGSLYVPRVHTGIFVGFICGFHHQIAGVRIPSLSELGAAHSDYSDPVLYPLHVSSLVMSIPRRMNRVQFCFFTRYLAG